MRTRLIVLMLTVGALAVPGRAPASVFNPIAGVGNGALQMIPGHLGTSIQCPLVVEYRFDEQTLAIVATSLEGSARDYVGPATASGVWAKPRSCGMAGLIPESGIVNSPSNPARFAGQTTPLTPGLTISGTFYGTYTRIDHVITALLRMTYRVNGGAPLTIHVSLVAVAMSTSDTTAHIDSVFTSIAN